MTSLSITQDSSGAGFLGVMEESIFLQILDVLPGKGCGPSVSLLCSSSPSWSCPCQARRLNRLIAFSHPASIDERMKDRRSQ